MRIPRQHSPRKLKYRHCGSCNITSPAGKFESEHGSNYKGGAMRTCPNCGVQAVTEDFPVIKGKR